MTEQKDLLVVGNLAMDLIGTEAKYGGSAASIAVNASRLGINTGVMSVLGRDDFSSQYLTFLSQENIDTELISRPLTLLPVCEVVARGNTIASSVWHDNGCHPAMEELTIEEEKIKAYRMVHLVSCPPGLAKHLAELGINLSFEPGPMLAVDPSYFDPDIARRSNFVFLNQEESEVVTLSQGLTSIGQIVTGENQILVVTYGKNGSKIFRRDRNEITCEQFPAVNVSEANIVDHIGAGDGYKSGFLSALLLGLDITRAARIGSKIGALAVQQTGGIIQENRMKQVKISLAQ